MSEYINKELFAALSKFQGEVCGAIKDSTNPHFKSQYANLESVWSVIKAPLASNGLCVYQSPVTSDGVDYMETTLGHVSGQCITSRMRLYLTKMDSQGMGSAITYARRYMLAAVLGIYQVDDDGESTKDAPPPTRVSLPAIRQPLVESPMPQEQFASGYQAPRCALPECNCIMKPSKPEWGGGWYCPNQSKDKSVKHSRYFAKKEDDSVPPPEDFPFGDVP